MSELNYRKAIEELEQILEAIEEESIGIDELGEKLKRANELMTYCRAKLKSTEEEVSRILASMEKEMED